MTNDSKVVEQEGTARNHSGVSGKDATTAHILNPSRALNEEQGHYDTPSVKPWVAGDHERKSLACGDAAGVTTGVLRLPAYKDQVRPDPEQSGDAAVLSVVGVPMEEAVALAIDIVQVDVLETVGGDPVRPRNDAKNTVGTPEVASRESLTDIHENNGADTGIPDVVDETNKESILCKNLIWAVAIVAIIVVLAVTATATVILTNKDPLNKTTESPLDNLTDPPSLSPTGPTVAVTEATKLTASDSAAEDNFGISVAIEGDHLVVGAYGRDTNRGAAYVFVRSMDEVTTTYNWIEQAILTAVDGVPYDNFGANVAIDSGTIVVGAAGESDNKGAAYVFALVGPTSWTLQAKLTASDGATMDQFGMSVAVSSDVVVVGAPSNDDWRGAAYIFVRAGTTWIQDVKLTASDGATDDQMGFSVAISGETIVVASKSIYVYTLSGTKWTEQAKLAADVVWSVAIDGNTIVSGAPFANSSATNSGAAFVFTRTGTTWTEQAKLSAADGATGDEFGTSVAIDGDMVVVGAYLVDSSDTDSGAALVFVRNGATWTEQTKLVASDAADGDWLGSAVGIAGGTIAIGARLDDDNEQPWVGSNIGSTYLYV